MKPRYWNHNQDIGTVGGKQAWRKWAVPWVRDPKGHVVALGDAQGPDVGHHMLSGLRHKCFSLYLGLIFGLMPSD